MEDEVFEKYYLQIENVFSVFGDYDYDISEWKRKQKIKQILEEIENSGYKEGYDHGFDDGLGQEE